MGRSPRYLLLPTWIKVFAWIFLGVGACCTVVECVGAIFNASGNFMLHGLEYSGPMRQVWPFAISLVFAFYGCTAYLLLWGKKEGRKAGLAAGYLGMALCLLGVVIAVSRGRFYIPLEPILQVPFVVTLHRLKGRWEEYPNQTP
jgi:hypothetical protein